jgi:metacaspase-1
MATPSSTPSGRKGLGLHIGLNNVDPKHYGGWDGPLAACENDARDMAALAALRGIEPRLLITKKATRAAVLAGLRRAARALKGGDLFVLTYSGHGGQVRDASGDEPDKKDETWCLYDAQLIDDELYYELSRFAAGVRILVLSDSCHSGTVTREREDPPPSGLRSKMMPLAVGDRVYRAHADFYDRLQLDVKKAAGGAVIDPDAALAQLAVSGRLSAIAAEFKPASILISGCQDNQSSYDGEHNGAYTEQLLKVWDHGAFAGNHAAFHARIKARMPGYQTPNLFTLGPAGRFLAERPFTV